jgi:hypothetical protein
MLLQAPTLLAITVAKNFTAFALCGLEEAQTVLRDALRAWKA